MTNWTPMIRQYQKIKAVHQDALLFFRLGDFYELFFDDAQIASRELEIVLTARDGGGGRRVPMCGIPHHAADNYLGRLVAKGYKVAICEQMEDPKEAKGIVKREVVRVVTPGTILSGQNLEAKKNNYLAAVSFFEATYGLAYTDITTGDFWVTQFIGENSLQELIDELIRLQPAECLLSVTLVQEEIFTEYLQQQLEHTTVSVCDEANFHPEEAYRLLASQLEDTVLAPLIGKEKRPALIAAGAVLAFIQDTQKQNLMHLHKLTFYTREAFMLIDAATRRNLELTETIRERTRKHSLLEVLDATVTAMGGRMLRQWLDRPLIDLQQINSRLEAVAEFTASGLLRGDVRKILADVYDLERLLGRIACGNAQARDLLALKESLEAIPVLKSLMATVQSPLLTELVNSLDPLADLADLIGGAINEDPPLTIREGGLIKTGYHPEIDQLREAALNGKQWILDLETREKEKTGIKSLKIGFNKVFGYYLTVTKANLEAVPDYYIRKQTLVNAERFVTPELEKYEHLVRGAEEKVAALEYIVFNQIRATVGQAAVRIQKLARELATVDTLAALAEVAVTNGYTRPEINNSDQLIINAGRHPVVEQFLADGFVANDTSLGGKACRIALITGPNMAGKSTYMRQVALIVIMSQIGSFVPASKAVIGVVDRIFARVGASDELTAGKSTFMIEMLECQAIIANATARSLLIMDEVGRGTSTYDGISIAQALIEYIHKYVGAKTLFSTHFHELTSLAETLTGVQNYTMAIKEEGETIVFLRQIIPGKTDRSYGIHVAKLAGIPEVLTKRATEILHELEGKERLGQKNAPSELALFPPKEHIRFEHTHSVVAELAGLKIMTMTPLQALNKLCELQDKLNKKRIPGVVKVKRNSKRRTR